MKAVAFVMTTLKNDDHLQNRVREEGKYLQYNESKCEQFYNNTLNVPCYY